MGQRRGTSAKMALFYHKQNHAYGDTKRGARERKEVAGYADWGGDGQLALEK